MWESKREYREERSDDDKLNSDRGCNLNILDDSNDDEDSEYEKIVTLNMRLIDTLKDARYLIILILYQFELL